MQCFRLSHAGFVLEANGTSLILDPGSLTSNAELEAALADAAPVAGVVITHEHADHWTPANIVAIREAFPNAPIFTTQATADALAGAGISEVVVVHAGDSVSAGEFALEFYGGTHEVLHRSIPVIDNVGVRINETFAWGGDSLAQPPFAAETLGVPIGSPWSNIGQVMDFVLEAAPRRAYLTHDGMLSAPGRGLYELRIRWCLEQVGGDLIDVPHALTDRGARFTLAD